MTRTALLAITLLSALAAPLVVHATTAASTQAQGPAASPERVAPSARDKAAPATGCARRVKVVYRGYGEGAGDPCGIAATDVSR